MNAPSIYKERVLENLYIVACPVLLLLFSVPAFSYLLAQNKLKKQFSQRFSRLQNRHDFELAIRLTVVE